MADLAVASVRRVVPGLYAARAIGSGASVHLSVRRTASVLGFASLSAGDLVEEAEGTSPQEIQFQTSASYRYLVVASPVVSGAADLNHASCVELSF